MLTIITAAARPFLICQDAYMLHSMQDLRLDLAMITSTLDHHVNCRMALAGAGSVLCFTFTELYVAHLSYITASASALMPIH